MVSAAAVTMMRSKGACSGQPFIPSPTIVVTLARRSGLKRASRATSGAEPVDGVDPPAELREDAVW